MEQSKSKKVAEPKSRKKFASDKKQKSDITSYSSGTSLCDPSTEKIFVVGKGFGCAKTKSKELSHRFHESYSETSINPLQSSGQDFKDDIYLEGVHQAPSNSSFLSAKSDLNEIFQKHILELEDKLVKQTLVISSLKKKLGPKEVVLVNSVATETDLSLQTEEQNSKFKDLEKKIYNRDKKIKDLTEKLEDCFKINDSQNEENCALSNRVSLLNRQLQSMFELLRDQKWNSIDASEFAKYKTKSTELEAFVTTLEEEKSTNLKKIKKLSNDLEKKERELNAKTRELVEYRNRSTLEMCKLLNEIDSLQKEAKRQSQLLDQRIMEAQSFMEDEIVSITQKLEEQYQEDVKTAIEKFHGDFERLANLPKTTIEQLLKFCEPDKVDFMTYQKEWDAQQATLERKIATMQEEHNREVLQLRDNYDSKVVFLKTQVEALSSQLKERKDIIDIFENELMVYKSNSSINLLKASTLGDDITALKELYTAEIFSQKQVHKLQLDIFEEKVRTLTEEILYHAKNEEIQMEELCRARKMAMTFREKYEKLVCEWEEKVEKDLKECPTEAEPNALMDSMVGELKRLMDSLKKSEDAHEERIKMLEMRNNDERLAFLQDIEGFKSKIEDLAKFEKVQTKLDETIQSLVKTIGLNYTKTVEALLMSHMTEVSLKHMEMCASEKRHVEEIDELKNEHDKEMEELRNKVEGLKEEKRAAEDRLKALRSQDREKEVENLKKRTQDIAVKCLKSEGMIAIKDETEKALSRRVRELEELLRKKEENCKKELEDLTAKYMKAEILSASKDDLVKELEEKLNRSQTLLEKSCREVDHLMEVCSVVNVPEKTMEDGGYLQIPEEVTTGQFEKSKAAGESLKRRMTKTFAKLEESSKAKSDVSIKQKLELLESEKKEILAREKSAIKERENALKANEFLEEEIQELNGRIDKLTQELTNRGNPEREEVVSFSLQEVRFLYEEEEEKSTVTGMRRNTIQVFEVNEKLHKENEALRWEPEEREKGSKVDPKREVTSKFKTMKKELTDILRERNQLMALSASLGKERNRLKEEVNRLTEENHQIRVRWEIPRTRSDDSGLASEMNEEIGKLTDYINTLTTKLEVMKTNNELLLTGSPKENQRRHEIEDQLAKVRKENALLSVHKNQLEKTNERISNLVAQGKPSVASWMKILEAVENIADEMLELKASFADSGTVSGPSTRCAASRSNSELKLMSETLHTQLKNKTVLCDEVARQKDALETELKNLESLLKWHDRGAKLEKNSRSRIEDTQCSTEVREGNESPESSESSHLVTLNMLKKRLEDQVELGEAQFRENLQLEILELKKEIQRPSGIEDECLKSIERRYEEEVAELTREFEREVERLKKEFGSRREEDGRETYGEEIEKLKEYFEKKWRDLEKRYTEIYRQKRQSCDLESEVQQITEQVRGIFSGEGEREEEEDGEKKTRLENVLKSALSRREEELRTLKEKYEEAVSMLESKHDSEVEKLQSAVLQLKENIMTALKTKETQEGGGGEGEEAEEKNTIEENLIEKIRAEYEAKLEEEKRKLSDMLESEKQKHERDLIGMEEFWTEKLSECETKCAIMKATSGRKGEKKNTGECEEGFGHPPDVENIKMSQASLEVNASEEEVQLEKYEEADFDSGDYVGDGRREEENPEESLCVSCLSNRSFFKGMEVKTDDDKLDVMQQRDTLEEMISSMRNIITKLVTFIGQYKPDLNNTTIDIDDTLYKSIHLDLDRTVTDASMMSNGGSAMANLSSIFQEIKENSLLNSSDNVRFELEKCLKQLKRDATSLLALSCPDNSGPNLNELLKKMEKEKKELEAKVLKVEEEQSEMRKEISTTKERLNQWERNLEVVSEGYGEEVVAPKQLISSADLKEKVKAFLTENCGHSPQDINLLEEICKEGDRLQKEWLKEKCDLQQQIEVADKQVHSLKKFLEEQAVEREQERETFDREIGQLREALKAKERDSSVQNRTNREVGRLSVMSLADESVEALVSQVKELTGRLSETEKNKDMVEGEFQNAVKKIWSLREVIEELEQHLAEVSERENNLKKKIEKLEGVIETEAKTQRNLEEELEAARVEAEMKCSEHIKSLEEELMRLRQVVDQVHPDSLAQFRSGLRHIEGVLIKKTKDLEQLHVSSANVSCSSPSEDVSIRDHLDATRCSTPDEMTSPDQPASGLLPVEEIDRVLEKLARHTRAEEVAMKYIQDLKMQLRTHRKAYEEIQTERDVLLEKVDGYLKENSSLKVRLEEQRCNAGLLQKQLNANLESQIGKLEVELEKLNEMCNEKDKQLRDVKVILENTTKSLKVRETEALNKSKEENALIVTLKTDLANALNENEKLEQTLEKTREKLRETLKMPALIDSMIDEKNAEIDRLEREVARLSSEKSTSGVTSRSSSTEERQKRRIKFSEPESFSENISSISPQCLSDLRDCSDSYADFRNSSLKMKRQPVCSTRLESVSSIAPLQLSPRGAESSFHWKTSSPILQAKSPESPPKPPSPTKRDLEQMEELSKLEKEIDSKRSEISELHLEIDRLKRQLVEASQEVATAKSRAKEIQNELAGKEEEIRKSRNNERSLHEAMESLKKNHREEVEELENKLKFERGKVETVYEEIKALEVKKIEIEEAFLSLREDYNEKINAEKKTADALLHRIRSLEGRNGELELKMASLGRELEKTIEESEKTVQGLSREISDLRNENACQKANAETQWEGEECVCQGRLTLDMPKTDAAPLKENLNELKSQFEKMAAVIGERDFNKKDAFVYAMTVRQLLTVVLGRVEELTKEVEAHMKKVMECSVDDLAVKVQKELVLSAKLDNQLLSSIEANGLVSKEATPQPDSPDVVETGGGDGSHAAPKPLGNAALAKVAGLYRDATNKMGELVREREDLKVKVSEQQKIIRLLEESLRKEKERILEEKDRCAEDAKIMELLRVNLEKRLHDVKSKERELRKEKQQRMGLEKEIETYKRQGAAGWESKKVTELSSQLESQKEKLVSMGQLIEEEKKKSQELKLSLEEERIERMSEKNARRLVESDLSILLEEKENLKMELLNARELLHSRNVEIGLLKRKINLQEIDIKALSISRSYQNPSDASSVSSNAGNLIDLEFAPESPTALLLKLKKLNSCVQRHVRGSSDVGDALLSHLSQETEPMRDILRRLEENGEGKTADDTLVADLELERKLWSLEKGKLVMDVETLRRENEILKRDLVDTSKSNELLKVENCKMKRGAVASPKVSEGVPNLLENGFLHEVLTHLTKKYMRTESYRKALAWQKNYLLITLQEYQRLEEEVWRKMGCRRKKEGKKKPEKSYGRFRVVALAVLSIFRMRFIVRKWRKKIHNHMHSLIEAQTDKLKPSPRASVLNIYNEPVNPLSYQTQNIFQRPSSQVLRTPPSRDPGPQGFSPDSKNVPERLGPTRSTTDKRKTSAT